MSITDLFKIDGQNLDKFDLITQNINKYKSALKDSDEATNDNPRSPVAISAVGYRCNKDEPVIYIPAGDIDEKDSPLEKCRQHAEYVLLQHTCMSTPLSFKCPIMPHLDVDETISITDSYYNWEEKSFLIQSISIPFGVGEMDVSAINVQWLATDTDSASITLQKGSLAMPVFTVSYDIGIGTEGKAPNSYSDVAGTCIMLADNSGFEHPTKEFVNWIDDRAGKEWGDYFWSHYAYTIPNQNVLMSANYKEYTGTGVLEMKLSLVDTNVTAYPVFDNNKQLIRWGDNFTSKLNNEEVTHNYPVIGDYMINIQELAHLKSSLGSMPASDVYAWAKASSKPSYSWSEITGKPSTFTPASHTHTSLPPFSVTAQNHDLEGGEILLEPPSSTTAGIRLDNYNNTFRILGVASSDGKTVTGNGTPLVISPYNKTITGGYTFTGSLNGNAATATALTTSAGSATQPVYFNDGKPVACTYTLGKSVPSNAVFTDTAAGKTFKTLTGKSHTGWTGNTTDDKIIPTMSFMALWNGAYSSNGASNLTYCYRGAFGTIVTKNAGDYATASHTHNYAGSPSAGGAANSANTLKTVLQNPIPTSDAGYWTYYGVFVSNLTNNSNETFYKNDGFKVGVREGTTSIRGESIIEVGNDIAQGTAGNKTGCIIIRSSSSGCVNIKAPVTKEYRVIDFPDKNGTIALTDDLSSHVFTTLYAGSTTNASTISYDSSSGMKIYQRGNYISFESNGVNISGASQSSATITLGGKLKSTPTYSNAISGSALLIKSDGTIGKATSSRRFKTNINYDLDFENYHNVLMNLKSAEYEYNSKLGTTELGMIAEEVEELSPVAALYEYQPVYDEDGNFVEEEKTGQVENYKDRAIIQMLVMEAQRKDKEIQKLIYRVNQLEDSLRDTSC